MAGSTESNDINKSAAPIRIAAFLLVVILVVSAVSVLSTVAAPAAPSPECGVADLTGFDFGKELATIENSSFAMYPGYFYMPEDIKAGAGGNAGVRYASPGAALGDFGTLRLEILLPPGQVYALAGKSVSYAQRLFIDGKECTPIGVTGTSADTVVPQSMRYTESFRPEKDVTEIVIHYSAFVHSDGGGLYPLRVGLARDIARAESLGTFRTAVVTAALLTAMLLFFVLFLFFSRSGYLLWFSLACGCVALNGMLISNKILILLMPELSWFLTIRLEYITTTGIALFSALYIGGLFPGAVNKWAVRGFLLFCVSNAFFICLTRPVTFTRYAVFFAAVYAAFGVYLLAAVVAALLRKKLASPLSGAEQIILASGFALYLLMMAVGIWAHQNGYVFFGLDYPQVAVMVFMFINILTLSLGFSRTEARLSFAQQAVAGTEARILALTQEKKYSVDPQERLSGFRLTKRESEVAWLILDGKSRDEIAGILMISRGTVNTYFTSIYKKAGCSSEAEFIRSTLSGGSG